jgi:hypothetical protein
LASQMSDQGTRISVNPSSSQTISMAIRRRRCSIRIELWEIIAKLATRAPIAVWRTLVMLQRGDAVGHVAVIDIHRIDLEKTIERLIGLPSHLK